MSSILGYLWPQTSPKPQPQPPPQPPPQTQAQSDASVVPPAVTTPTPLATPASVSRPPVATTISAPSTPMGPATQIPSVLTSPVTPICPPIAHLPSSPLATFSASAPCTPTSNLVASRIVGHPPLPPSFSVGSYSMTQSDTGNLPPPLQALLYQVNQPLMQPPSSPHRILTFSQPPPAPSPINGTPCMPMTPPPSPARPQPQFNTVEPTPQPAVMLQELYDFFRNSSNCDSGKPAFETLATWMLSYLEGVKGEEDIQSLKSLLAQPLKHIQEVQAEYLAQQPVEENQASLTLDLHASAPLKLPEEKLIPASCQPSPSIEIPKFDPDEYLPEVEKQKLGDLLANTETLAAHVKDCLSKTTYCRTESVVTRTTVSSSDPSLNSPEVIVSRVAEFIKKTGQCPDLEKLIEDDKNHLRPLIDEATKPEDLSSSRTHSPLEMIHNQEAEQSLIQKKQELIESNLLIDTIHEYASRNEYFREFPNASIYRQQCSNAVDQIVEEDQLATLDIRSLDEAINTVEEKLERSHEDLLSKEASLNEQLNTVDKETDDISLAMAFLLGLYRKKHEQKRNLQAQLDQVLTIKAGIRQSEPQISGSRQPDLSNLSKQAKESLTNKQKSRMTFTRDGELTKDAWETVSKSLISLESCNQILQERKQRYFAFHQALLWDIHTLIDSMHYDLVKKTVHTHAELEKLTDKLSDVEEENEQKSKSHILTPDDVKKATKLQGKKSDVERKLGQWRQRTQDLLKRDKELMQHAIVGASEQFCSQNMSAPAPRRLKLHIELPHAPLNLNPKFPWLEWQEWLYPSNADNLYLSQLGIELLTKKRQSLKKKKQATEMQLRELRKNYDNELKALEISEQFLLNLHKEPELEETPRGHLEHSYAHDLCVSIDEDQPIPPNTTTPTTSNTTETEANTAGGDEGVFSTTTVTTAHRQLHIVTSTETVEEGDTDDGNTHGTTTFTVQQHESTSTSEHKTNSPPLFI
ncbi:hypothetical protein Pelo_8502 [Pelomyxa schiedti]|nr:hypothetical protein Pelo_8502 [Pelomyxa schiedti]